MSIQRPFDYSEIALIDAIIQMGKGVAVKDLKLIDKSVAFELYMERLNVPEIGSRWFNNRRQKIYTVHGVVAHCEGGDDWEILYRSDDMPVGQFRRRGIDDWYGVNRDGEPRFVLVNQ